jgi:hypothetical protein
MFLYPVFPKLHECAVSRHVGIMHKRPKPHAFFMPGCPGSDGFTQLRKRRFVQSFCLVVFGA